MVLDIYQGGGAPNLLTPPIHAALVMNLRSCEDRRRPHPHGGQGVAYGSNSRDSRQVVAHVRRSQKGGNFLVGGTWGRRRRRMRAQKGGARIYLFDFYLFVESESLLINGQSRLYFVQFLKRPVWRKISTKM